MVAVVVRAIQNFTRKRCRLNRISLKYITHDHRNTINPKDGPDEWLFDTVKAPTILQSRKNTKRRKLSVINTNDQSLYSQSEEGMKKLDLKDSPLEYLSSPKNTIVKGTARRQVSISRKSTLIKDQRTPSGQRRPLQPDLSFGNTGSTVRLFRRVSDNFPTSHVNCDMTPVSTTRNESKSSASNTVSKEAMLGRRIFNQVFDPALQELHAQTSSHPKREKLSRLADALSALNAIDPEGEFQLLKLVMERVQADSNLCPILCPSPKIVRPQETKPQVTPAKVPTKLVMAQNNPHLKSHRRRHSQILSDSGIKEKLTNLPGQVVPGMEHTKQLADVLYSRWADGLRNRWPAL